LYEQYWQVMIDSLDKELIALLEQDAKQTSEKLAERLNMTSSTIRRRLKRLVERGTIRIVAIPEPKQIGSPLIAIMAFQLAHDKAESFLKALNSRKEVKCLYVTSGRFDAIALMWFSSTEQLFSFVEKSVSQLEGVKATETFICIHVEKTF
jgi:DNA-binding Lrp family transcriptional regulator